MTMTEHRAPAALDRSAPEPVLPARGRPAARLAAAVKDGVIRVAEAVTTPLLPSDYLDLIDPLRGGADLRGRIVAIEPETADAATVVIRPGRGWAGHVPGQYIRIGVDVDGVRLWRAYSLTSGPRADGCLTITVKAIPDGKVSNHLVRHARPGTVVQMDQATGDFHLPADVPERVLFVTAGSGITPVMGMLRHGLATSNLNKTASEDLGSTTRHGEVTPLRAAGSRLRDVVVVHSAPTSEDVIFGEQLRDMHRAGGIRLVERHTDAEGLLEPSELDLIVPDWAQRQTWACGPTGLLDALEDKWAAAGVAERMHTERFRPHIVVTGEGGSVSFAKSGVTVEADAATPLLEAGESAGLLMPSGCRMGICFGCVAPLESGAVRDLRTGAVTTAAPGDGVKIQTCISAAAGPCEVDL